MSQSPDVIIVGGGIVGAACALECARAGLKTLVLERGTVGGGATAAGMGHLVTMDDSEAQFQLTAYSCRLWRALLPRLPADIEYDTCGTLWVAADEEEMNEVLRKYEYYTSRGVSCEVVKGDQLHREEPSLRKSLAGALRVPGDAVIYPPCAARFLLEQAKLLGADVRTGVEVRQLLDAGGVLLTDGSRIDAGLSVNAAGAASVKLTQEAPVRPRKGHLLITDRYPGYVRHQIIELGYLKSAHSVAADSVAFNIQPRKTGQMLIGSSRQYQSEDSQVEMDILVHMLERAATYLPSLNRLSALRVWTGQRAATPDKLPLIGPSVHSQKVWLATGHEGLGITTSLATGALLIDLIMNRRSEIDPVPYAPSRFSNTTGQHA